MSNKSCLGSNFPAIGFLIRCILLMFSLKLAQVALFLDELSVVIFAVESALVCNVVGWADYTPSMGAFETALVIRSPIYSNLRKRESFSNIMYDVHELY